MQAQSSNVVIQQQADGPLPLLKYQSKLVKDVSGIIPHLFNALAIKATTMLRTQLHANCFEYFDHFCYDAVWFFHLY
jgi:hypothetical protein